MEDNISPIYKELEIISKRKLSKLEREKRRIGVRLFLLGEGTIMVDSELTSSV